MCLLKVKRARGMKHIKLELIIVWTIITAVTLVVLILPFILDYKTILSNTPVCLSIQQYNVECSLCGMTRAFIEISNGNIKAALLLNKGSMAIYFLFLFNAILYAVFIIYSKSFLEKGRDWKNAMIINTDNYI